MKRLVICCDGTWSRADQERDEVPCPTNVVKIAYRIAKRDQDVAQVIYYDHGVGTGNILDRLSGGALGKGLEENIHDAYRFLIANYEEGDEIFLFGFSRGAFTARSLGGMVRNCGILRRDSVAQYRNALKLYRDEEHHPDHPYSVDFRARYSIGGEARIPIRCIGVWDTVGALGIPVRGLRGLTRKDYQFHDTELSGSVQYAFHALAIDERRAPFEATLWAYEPKPPQVVEQVWFCGVHSDVGGGYPEIGLSDLALDWMIEKAQGAGLSFDAETQRALPTRGDPRGKLHNSKTGLYRLTPGSDRVIGKSLLRRRDGEEADEGSATTDPTQSLHASVLQRWDSDPSYRPKPLREYFVRVGDRRAQS
jgi:uncharacterized protein (DUF2235 family)